MFCKLDLFCTINSTHPIDAAVNTGRPRFHIGRSFFAVKLFKTFISQKLGCIFCRNLWFMLNKEYLVCLKWDMFLLSYAVFKWMWILASLQLRHTVAFLGYRSAFIARWRNQSFWYNAGLWETDGQTDAGLYIYQLCLWIALCLARWKSSSCGYSTRPSVKSLFAVAGQPMSCI